MALPEETVLQRRIGPLEIEPQRNRLTHPLVLQFLAAKVKDEPRRRRRQSVGQLGLDHMPPLHRRKIVPGRPGLGITLGPERVDARLERLERRIVVGEILDPYTIEIMPPLVDRQMPAPVIGVALIDDVAVHIIALDLIGAGSRCRLQPRLIQPRAGILIPLARKHRRAPHLINQRPAGNALGKGEFHPVIVQRLGAQHPALDRIGIGFQPLFQKQVMRKHHVMRRDRRAIGKPRLGPHMENHPGLALVIFQPLGQQAITLVIAIPRQRLAGGLRSAQEALVDHPRQPPGAALARIGVHRVERAGRI